MADDGGIRVTLSSQAISGYGHRKTNHAFTPHGQAIVPVRGLQNSDKGSQPAGHGQAGAQTENTLRADTQKALGRGTKINTVA
ncbi:MAG: hypothetical protein HQK60_12250 [Deltaproteobacteria bacterium]|nr:hypothetical protein [Deltaproteobacteria bacterium]